MQTTNNKLHCAFLMGKSRVAPLRSPPWMELTAATVAVKIDTILKRELQFDLAQSIFWTDLMWSNGNMKAPTRIQLTASLEGMGDDLLKNTSWISGPEFLCGPVECWPKSPLSNAEIALDDPEIKKVMVNSIGVE